MSIRQIPVSSVRRDCININFSIVSKFKIYSEGEERSNFSLELFTILRFLFEKNELVKNESHEKLKSYDNSFLKELETKSIESA